MKTLIIRIISACLVMSLMYFAYWAFGIHESKEWWISMFIFGIVGTYIVDFAWGLAGRLAGK